MTAKRVVILPMARSRAFGRFKSPGGETLVMNQSVHESAMRAANAALSRAIRTNREKDRGLEAVGGNGKR